MSKKVVLSLAALGLAAIASPAAALDWSDTSISYRLGTNFREPAVTRSNGKAREITKNIVGFTHVNGYSLGGNFINIDLLKSNRADPASGGDTGAVEAYAVYRHDLSLNKVTGTKNFSFGPIKDIAIEAGIDLNTKNTTFASRKVMPVFGPSFSFDVPGFLTVAVLASKEWNHNGITKREVQFDATPILASAWNIPLGTVGVPMNFEGFANVIGPKGKDGFNRETKMEILARPKLMWDVGAAFGKEKTFKAGFGWQYWYNKFGNDHTKVKGSIENAPIFEAQIHF